LNHKGLDPVETAMSLLLVLAVVSSTALPTLDIARGCKPEESLEGQAVDQKSCMEDERATKDKLAKEWSSYPVAARNVCVGDRSSLVNSYVELLTCIEMQTWKNDPSVLNPTAVTAGQSVTGGAIGGSPPLPGQMGGSGATHPLGGSPTVHIH
jgi:hypothetical protein